jgi:hypothetical protein
VIDMEALDQAVRERLPNIRRGLCRGAAGATAIWAEGIGFVPMETIEIVLIAYRRIMTNRMFGIEMVPEDAL